MPKKEPRHRTKVYGRSVTDLRLGSVRELLGRPINPMIVMQENLEFFHLRAQRLQQVLEGRLRQAPSPDDCTHAEYTEWLNRQAKRLRNLVHAREMAQRCAVDLAQFTHPKLQAVAVKDLDGSDGDSAKRTAIRLIAVDPPPVEEAVPVTPEEDAGDDGLTFDQLDAAE